MSARRVSVRRIREMLRLLWECGLNQRQVAGCCGIGKTTVADCLVLDLLGFKQQLYLRQPGYGTCYLTGKFQLEDLMRERAHQLGNACTMKRWFEEVYSAGIIPVSLIRWQLTGKDEEIRAILANE